MLTLRFCAAKGRWRAMCLRHGFVRTAIMESAGHLVSACCTVATLRGHDVQELQSYMPEVRQQVFDDLQWLMHC